ncbi:DUF3040 domain-containing protein [Pseudonocardia saturnea]
MSLSPREQRILAGIEDDLGGQDPALAARFTRSHHMSAVGIRFPLSPVHTGALLLALLLLIAVHAIAGDLVPAGTGLLTWALIAPWMVSAARASALLDGNHSAGTPRPGPPDKSLST